MSVERPATHPLEPDMAQPVVLIGGRSTRFGSDKLSQTWAGSMGGDWLVDQPRLALERVLGPRVWGVGDAAAMVAARFTRVIADAHPGAGPAGGIATALAAAAGPVAVLAGDLPFITDASIRRLVAAVRERAVDAAIGWTDRPQPCIAVYRPRCAEAMAACAARGAAVMIALDGLRLVRVPIDEREARNANRPEDLQPGD